MIFKGSPAIPDANHIDDPLINLGVMNSGGISGSSGRVTKGNQPGPHAITSTASGLLYDYDDNGNMTSHATGELYEWDFHDRLIKSITATTIAEYVYDYSGQRVIKKSQTGATSRVDIYVGEGFELRNGKPVKFIFADGQRLARVEGRLAETDQATLQELHFKPGWNFFSLQIEPTVAAVSTVLAPLDGNYTEVWAFDSVTQQYQGFIPSGGANDLSEIHAQRGYIINVANAATLQVTGIRKTDPISLQSGFNLIPSPADAPVSVQDALSTLANNYQGVWGYQTEQEMWRGHLPNKPFFLSKLDSLQPDKAYWLELPSAAQLLFQHQEKKILFYHSDHLGSSSVVTDLSGDVVESTEFYPFGRPRHEHKNGFDADYKYTGKELDNETGLMYYEARYLDAVTGRFVSVDPLAVAPPSAALLNPQFIHSYSYAGNNPINYMDPDGLEVRDPDQNALTPIAPTALSGERRMALNQNGGRTGRYLRKAANGVAAAGVGVATQADPTGFLGAGVAFAQTAVEHRNSADNVRNKALAKTAAKEVGKIILKVGLAAAGVAATASTGGGALVAAGVAYGAKKIGEAAGNQINKVVRKRKANARSKGWSALRESIRAKGVGDTLNARGRLFPLRNPAHLLTPLVNPPRLPQGAPLRNYNN